jgi:GNAT superfamily N-acetyltransferase
MTSISLRPAVRTDLPHIFRLVRGLAEYERKLDTFTCTEADLATLLFGPEPRAQVILAEPPGAAPVGIALFYYVISTFTGRAGLFLEDLFVEPSYRGQGIGLALLRALSGRAMAENCYAIEWRVLDWNQPAIDFYQRLGAVRMQGWQTRELKGAALAALAQGAQEHG